ncbi:procathepsin L-like [Paramacrobiotus metropolitanus]|uniref:procathepsin L-like n=1 Tax=Paramacrobiotus metropolitanus TaxID=2943436 RepID=UPI002445A860|nr:procathepsin L-like [Paramacrobiotus metropolitanus]
MNSRVALTLLLVAVHAYARHPVDSDLDSDWKAWKIQHGKTYAGEEEHHRRITWENNVKQITHHNIQYSLGKTTYTMGVNQFTDLTLDEFSRLSRTFTASPRTGLRHKHRRHHHKQHSDAACKPTLLDEVSVPDAVDWRTEGYVTVVRSEQGCISSQYFAINGALEGQWFRKTGQLNALSEQNLKDCCEKDPTKCSTYVNGTCTLDETYQYLKINGVETLSDYPDSAQPGKCAYDPKKRAATLSGYDFIDATEKQLKVAVASIGPIASAMDSSQPSFMTYAGGVYNEPNCSSTNLDHAVLIVGYGTDPTAGDYWIVKNSFGPDWGLKGYILMSRNKNNQCGIATTTTYPYFSC